MSLVTMKTLLDEANKKNYAVGAFDVFDSVMAEGVIAAAEESRSPVILAWAEGFNELMPIENLAPMLLEIARRASVPVAVHLDHATNLSIIKRCVEAGFTSVMADNSEHPFEVNVKNTDEVIALCRPKDITVEAELGHVSGNEGMYADDTYIYTDVKEASEFVKLTGVDCLAVAVGTVHGVYKSKPVLSLDLIKEIKAATGIPLVLHGGSGLSDDDFRNTVKCGINKINIFTDLTLNSLKYLRENDLSGKKPFIKVVCDVREAVKEETLRKMELFGCKGMAF